MKLFMALMAATSALRPISDALMQTRFADEITENADFDEITHLSQADGWDKAKNSNEQSDYLFEAPGE